MTVCRSQSLSVPLAEVTHLFYLKVNVGQSPLKICKKKIRKTEHFNDTSSPRCLPQTTKHPVTGKRGRKWQGRVTFPPFARCTF